MTQMPLPRPSETIPADPPEPHGARDDGRAPLTLAAGLVAVCVGLMVTGISYGFFDWVPEWVHGAVFCAATALALIYIPRAACRD